MAKIKMPDFRSDAVFEGSAEVEGLFSTSQIVEKDDMLTPTSSSFKGERFYSDYVPPSVEPGASEGIGGKQLWASFQTSKLNPKFEHDSNILSCEILKCENAWGTLEVESCIATLSANRKTFTITIQLKNQDTSGLDAFVDFTLYYEAAPRTYSYYATPRLFGIQGSLHDIQKRLENLENNFEQIQNQKDSLSDIKIKHLKITESITTPATAHGCIQFKEYRYTTSADNNSFQTNKLHYILRDINDRLIKLGV